MTRSGIIRSKLRRGALGIKNRLRSGILRSRLGNIGVLKGKDGIKSVDLTYLICTKVKNIKLTFHARAW